MGKTVNSSVALGKMTFTFTDEDGEVFASFLLNPMDVNVAKRCDEVGNYFEKKSDWELSSIDDLLRVNKEMEDKICYILGYDARESLFGNVPATTLLESGEMFVSVVVSTISDAVKAETEKRASRMKDAVEKYTSKYK